MSAPAKTKMLLRLAGAVLTGICLAKFGLPAQAEESSATNLNFGSKSPGGWSISNGPADKKREPGKTKLPRPTTKWIPVNPNMLQWSDSTKPADSQKPIDLPKSVFGLTPAKAGSGTRSVRSEAPATSLLQDDDPTNAGGSDKKSSKVETEVLKLAEAKDYKQAFTLLEQATRSSPEDARLWFNKGLMAERLSKWTEAKDDFEKAGSLKASLKPKSSLELARIYSKDGDTKKAGVLLWELKDKVRSDQSFEGNIDGLLIEIADERAVAVPSIIANASDRELAGGISRAEKSGKVASSIALSREYERRNSFKSDAENRLGYILYNAGKYSEALPVYRKGDELESSNPQFLLNVIACCTQLGLLEDIQQARKDFVARFPSDPRSKTIQEQIEYYNKDFSKTRSRESQPAQRGSDTASFSKNCMPLKVYAPDLAHATEDWRTPPDPGVDCCGILMKALEAWAEASGSKITFQQTASLDDSNIAIEWVNDASSMTHSFAAGSTGVATNARGQRRSRIQLLVPTKKQAGNSGVFTETTLHELGHALGLSHSSDPGNIMYFSEVTASEQRNLSDNDKQRINELYK